MFPRWEHLWTAAVGALQILYLSSRPHHHFQRLKKWLFINSSIRISHIICLTSVVSLLPKRERESIGMIDPRKVNICLFSVKMVFWSKWLLLAELMVLVDFWLNVYTICFRRVTLCKCKNDVHVVCIVYCLCFCSLSLCIDISIVFMPSTEMEPLKAFCSQAVRVSVCACSCTKSLWTRYLTDHFLEFHYIYASVHCRQRRAD